MPRYEIYNRFDGQVRHIDADTAGAASAQTGWDPRACRILAMHNDPTPQALEYPDVILPKYLDRGETVRHYALHNFLKDETRHIWAPSSLGACDELGWNWRDCAVRWLDDSPPATEEPSIDSLLGRYSADVDKVRMNVANLFEHCKHTLGRESDALIYMTMAQVALDTASGWLQHTRKHLQKSEPESKGGEA